MRLSQLAYEIVSDSINIGDTRINYYDFLNNYSDYASDKDFAMQVAGVFNALNLGLSRLLASRKVPYSHIEVEMAKDGYYDFDKGEIVNVVELRKDGDYENLEFRTLNLDGRAVVSVIGNYKPSKILIEYEPYLPHFSESDLKEIGDDTVDNNIDLAKWGITNQMCDYVKEFACAKVTEYLDPYYSNIHNNRAEQYFSDLKTSQSAFYQKSFIDTGWYR